MIDARFHSSPPQATLVIRPNQSWTWRANLYFLAILFAVSLTIGVSFALRGYWLVLPFTVLELCVLSAAFWYCVRRGYQQQVITVEPEQVHVEIGQLSPQPRVNLDKRFERFHTRFQIDPAS